MRRLTISALLLFTALSATAQDAGMIAMQQAQQANQMAMQAQQAQQFAQQASDAASQPLSCCAIAKPSFSMKPGAYGTHVTLRLKDRSRSTIIFYTTDGWTPTTLSTRYTGPITLTASTTLQAIAVGPGQYRSRVATAVYKLPSASTTPASSTLSSLDPGAPIRLTFTAPVNSKGLQIGDTLPIALADDLYLNGTLFAPKSTPVLATVTQIDNAAHSGLPASLSFAVHSFTANGRTIPLLGAETKEGRAHTTAVSAINGIPFVGLTGNFIHGTEVEIPQGTALTATINPAAPLSASK